MARLKRHLTKILAGLLSAWLSGLLLLICCHMQPVNAAEYCPLEKLGIHCDRAEKEKNSAKLAPDDTQQEIDCCAFIPAFFDKTRTFDTYQPAGVAASPTAVETARILFPRANFEPVSNYRSAVLPRNNTFLKNRTFRI